MAKIMVKLLVLVFAFIVFSVSGFILYSGLFQKTHLASYIDKIRRLESIQNIQKAVFIGGSASHFGIQAELFEKETAVPSVNMGLYADGSFKMYMDNVLPYLGDGDAVFLCPEYEYYSSGFDKISDGSIDLVYMSGAAVFKNTSMFYKIKAAPETLISGWRHLGNIIKYHAAASADKNYKNVFLGDYRRDYSDAYGDYKGIKNIPNKSFEKRHFVVYDDRMFLSELDKYAGNLVKNNIGVYLLFPPGTGFLFEISALEIEKIYSAVLLLKNITPLFHPGDVLYTDDNFFDTFYHLNYDAAIQYTRYIISRYKEVK
ncbi:MAG: hypothetical protein LBK08_13280 [Treponema sp.]|jgi:hypothetical protein|nr:hypothetical protein [Treponema sp.]